MSEGHNTVFEENLSMGDAINMLQTDIPAVGAELSEKIDAGEALTTNEQAIYGAISSPTTVALMRELNNAGVEELKTEGASSETAIDRVSSILSSGRDSFYEQGLEAPDLTIYYEAENIASQTGQQPLDVVKDIELARSLQITGENLHHNVNPAIDTLPSGDTLSNDTESFNQIAQVDQNNVVDIEVVAFGYPLELDPHGRVQTGHGQSSLVLLNKETGEMRYATATPDKPYPGNIDDYITDRSFDDDDLKFRDPSYITPLSAEASENADHRFLQHGSRVIQQTTIRGDWAAVNEKLTKFNEFIDEQDIPFRPNTGNSTTYEGDVWELLTGEEPADRNPGFIGRDENLMDYSDTEYGNQID